MNVSNLCGHDYGVSVKFLKYSNNIIISNFESPNHAPSIKYSQFIQPNSPNLPYLYFLILFSLVQIEDKHLNFIETFWCLEILNTV